jgi:hypothetical protein
MAMFIHDWKVGGREKGEGGALKDNQAAHTRNRGFES